MKRGALIAVSVVGLILLGGCVGPLADDAPDESTNADANPANGTTTPATATEVSSPTETATATATAAATETATETATPEASWSEPEQPNRPLQDNREDENGSRIHDVEVIGSGGGEDGNASFRIDVTANTSMPAVDPPEYGTPRGEPYFLVYLDAETDSDDRFTYVEGDLVERSPELSHESEGEYTLTVPQEALEHYGAEPGEHELLILLMDEDKDWDDIYGLQRITVEYQPEDA